MLNTFRMRMRYSRGTGRITRPEATVVWTGVVSGFAWAACEVLTFRLSESF